MDWYEKPLPDDIEAFSLIRKRVVRCILPFRCPREKAIVVCRNLEQYLIKNLREARIRTGSPDPITIHIFAAGLLTFGHLEMVNLILDTLPCDVKPDRPTGYCVALGSTALRQCLPLPEKLQTGIRTLVNGHEIREWYIHNQDNLIWNDKLELFTLKDTG